MQYNKELADRAAQRMRNHVKEAREGNPVGMRIAIEMADYMIPMFVAAGPLFFDYINNPEDYPENGPLIDFIEAMQATLLNPNQPVM